MVHRSHDCCQSAPRIDCSWLPGRLQCVYRTHSRRILLLIHHLRTSNAAQAPDYPCTGYSLGTIQTRRRRGANNRCCDWLQHRWHLLLVLASYSHCDCCYVELVFCRVLGYNYGSFVVVMAASKTLLHRS